ncbi:helix-turn-helix domain-containing protein [Pseudonocardia sp. N23]|uniref:helix-turn-helix domain-containing protein n=1 Tax=Pseudonocardia sp. N23 TaxID=1987376 RepID=UPI001559CCE6|nr:helix-turn-helix transcriptional regulator [Pseudonocardia sp. N23]
MNQRDDDEADFYRTIGQAIRHQRSGRQISQSRLASLLGMSRASIGNIEAGRQRVQLHVLAWIAFELDVTIHSLVPEIMQTARPRGTMPAEEAVFTDSKAQEFVEETLRRAQEKQVSDGSFAS